MTVSPSIPQFIVLKIRTQADNPALLEGLDSWLELGLLSDAEIKYIGQEYLSQPLSQPTELQPQSIQPQPRLVSTSPSNFFNQLWQSFKAEISVRWLLFLGLFMVVISSGVLAASQWDRFPAFGQYGVLFTYTLGFCLASFWSRASRQLPLTAQSLRWITILLVPLNFWAINALGLGEDLTTAWVVAIATFLLTGIIIFCNRVQGQWQISTISNQLFLSYLHLGWDLPNFPVIAVYLGIFSSLIVSFRLSKPNTNPKFLPYVLPFAFLVIHGTLTSQFPIESVAFAIGLGGWLLYLPSSQLWQGIAYLILAASWFLSIETQPWQAFGISVLALQVLTQSLKQDWRKFEIIALFLTGLQTYILTWRLIPETGRETILNTATQLTQSQNQPNVLIALSWFPYIILWVVIAEWLRQLNQPKLAKFAQQLNLGLGCFMASIGLFNPTVRSLNLLLSSITLLIITYRRPNGVKVYLTHIAIISTVISWISWQFPQIIPQHWVIIFISLMIGEWGIYRWQLNQENITNSSTALLHSSAYFGFGFAGISYILLLGNFNLFDLINCRTTVCSGFTPWGLSWITTPIVLTILVYSYCRRNAEQDRFQYTTPNRPLFKATEWGMISCILLQFLTIGLPIIRLISFGISTAILCLNSRIKPHVIQAGLTLGFAITSILLFLWEGIPGMFTLSLTNLWLVLALILNSLWLLQQYGLKHSNRLSQTYTTAINTWGNSICGLEILGLTIYSAGVYNQLLPQSYVILLATILTFTAMIYRSWVFIQQDTEIEGVKIFRLPPLLIYCLSLLLELLIVQMIDLTSLSTISLAITNLLFGLSTQAVGYYLNRREETTYLPSPWYVIPLVLATVNLIILLNTNETLGYIFTAITITFYLILAQSNQQIRLTYFALGLANLVIFRELLSAAVNPALLWWMTPVAFSCLYIAQVDSSLKHPQKRQTRHFIRCFATGLICGTALITYAGIGIIPGIFSLIAIFAGLGLRVRAFLYIGTAAFLINVCHQFIILNAVYSFLKWVIGFCVGLGLIWIAATFETRREQVLALFRGILAELEQWE